MPLQRTFQETGHSLVTVTSAARRLATWTALAFGLAGYLLFLLGAYSAAGLAAGGGVLMALSIRD